MISVSIVDYAVASWDQGVWVGALTGDIGLRYRRRSLHQVVYMYM